MPETDSEVAVSNRIEYRKRVLQVRTCLDEFPGEPFRYTVHSLSDAGFARLRSALEIAQDNARQFTHWPKLPAQRL